MPRLFAYFFALTLWFAIVGCNDAPVDNVSAPTPTPTPVPVPAACLAVVQPPNTDPNRPAITLKGPRVVSQPAGVPYADAGATATDAGDGDITSRIVVTGLDAIAGGAAGDYLVRYNVSDSRGSAATEAVRVVRVNSGRFVEQTGRDFGTTSAVMGYYEHLPAHYSDDPAQTFPLIVHNHGAGENADIEQSPLDRYAVLPDKLDLLLRRGLSGIIDQGMWDDTRPFIVLSPQRCVAFLDAHIESFVQYAVNTYNVDPTRIYMTGFSAGAYLTWEHVRLNPSQLAAAVTISGGGNQTYTAGCVMKDTPTWSFHAADDATVSVWDSINTVRAIDSCEPSVPHRLTIYPSGGHLIDIPTLELTTLGQGEPQYDLFDQNLYTWLLQFTRPAVAARVVAGPVGVPAVTLSAKPEVVALGRAIRLEWSAGGAAFCSASGDWAGARPASGAETLMPPAAGSYGYVLTCSGPGGTEARSATVRVEAEGARGTAN